MAPTFKTTIEADKGTLISGNLYYARGTYNASGVTLGEVDLSSYFSVLIEANLHPLNGTPTLRYGPNTSENGTTTGFDGVIGVQQVVSGATGTWFALGLL